MKNIGWIGLGTMGSRMASNLAKSGDAVLAWNRTANSEGAKAAEAAGCKLVGSIKEVAAASDLLFLSVGDENDVEEVLFGTGGAIRAMSSGSVVVDTSTIPPASAAQFARWAQDKGCAYLDCPVSGGDAGAAARTLVAMIGGDLDDVERVTLTLSKLCKTIHYCGAAGSGQAVKLCNQVLCAVNMVGLCEAFDAAQSLGIDPQTVIEVCSGGAADSWALRNLGPRIVSDNLTEGFRATLMRKDLRIVGDSLKRTLPGVALADDLLKRADEASEDPIATQGMILAYGGENARPLATSTR